MFSVNFILGLFRWMVARLEARISVLEKKAAQHAVAIRALIEQKTSHEVEKLRAEEAIKKLKEFF